MGFAPPILRTAGSPTCPTGKSKNSCPAPFQKIFRFANRQKQIDQRSLIPKEGRLAIVTNVGDGMRWTERRRAHLCADERRFCGRRSRVVLTPRRWRQVFAGSISGESDGGNKARSPGRARRKPLKPLRREGRVFPVNLW